MGIKGVLMKPIAKADMAKTVRKTLDEVTKRNGRPFLAGGILGGKHPPAIQ